ncbi:hypothetical protein AB0G32_13660 [Streptomyces sp. NPDC023723]|uniref:hypothetical protein n=1 Tax=Streptomyces sp. NPDC023723 TaxID=3154323 RepID=UPI0033E9A70A
MVKGRKRQLPSKLDQFKPYLADRWAETDGHVTILGLHREITARGFRGHYSTVRDWIRRDLPQQEGVPAPPTTVDTTGDRLAHPASHDPDRRGEAAPRGRTRPLPEAGLRRRADQLVRGDAHTPQRRPSARVDHRGHDANLPGISSFAAGLNSDLDAVTAGLTTDWNSGPVEGAVNRIKMRKRRLFGRAGFGLLRKRVPLS